MESLGTGSKFQISKFPQLILKWYMGAVVPWFPSSTAKSAKSMCVTWFVTPNGKRSSPMVIWNGIQVALLPQRCCPDQPCAHPASRSPSPSRACGIAQQGRMGFHAQGKKCWDLFWVSDESWLAGFCFNGNFCYLKISPLVLHQSFELTFK